MTSRKNIWNDEIALGAGDSPAQIQENTQCALINGMENCSSSISLGVSKDSISEHISELLRVTAAHSEEIARLKEEVAHLSAKSNRHTARHGWNVLWERIGSGAKQFLLFFPSTVEAEPIGELTLAANADGKTVWEMTGNDPRAILHIANRGRAPRGRYQLRFEELEPILSLENPALYVDSGSGFSEETVQPVRFVSSRRGSACAYFILPFGTQTLRFDPSTKAGAFTMGSACIRRLTAAEYYLRIAVHLAREAGGKPAKLGEKIWRSAEILASNGPRALARALREAYIAGRETAGSYEKWIEEHDTLTDARLGAIREQITALEERPLISVVMPVYNTPERLLREAIESVRGQVYDNWELCIADDHSRLAHVKDVLREYARKDPRIKVVFRQENGHISEATNSAFELASGSWIALMDHDDILRPHALAEVAFEIAAYPDAELIYSDEDKLDDSGRRYDPYFKPDFSRELFRSQNYLNHLTVHRAENIRAVGGWREGFEGSQDYDLNLRIIERIDARKIRHIPKVLYHWRAVSGSTAVAGSEKSYAYTAGLRALQEHIERMQLPAKAVPAPGTPFYRVQFDVPEPAPLVSLIIPTRDKVHLLRGCVTSIREKTTYPNYEVIVVDNGSCEEETLAYLDALGREPWARVLRYQKPFNYSAINNYAVEHAKGSMIGLINNDIEVISPDWLTEMVSWAAQPDIGCVGAKLYYGNDTIQHAGVILGLGGVAGHSHKHFPRDHPGYFFRLKVLQNLSAVTAACLIVRRSVFKEVGGLNERDLTVAFNDVDFCIKVREAGYLNVWTPYAELYHLESVSRGGEDTPEKQARFEREALYLKQSWALHPDPYYSVNLTRDREDFSIA